MARIQVGDRVAELSLPDIDGSMFSIDQIGGRRYLLSFFRFAYCPFCNLRVHQLVKHFPEFGPDFTVVSIFDASLPELQRSAEKHRAPFAILADGDNRYYRQFAVERSYLGVLKGFALRFPQLLYSVLIRGNIPRRIGGHVATMPLNLLIDEEGVVQYVHYGRDEGDHIPLDRVREFALSGRVPGEPIEVNGV